MSLAYPYAQSVEAMEHQLRALDDYDAAKVSVTYPTQALLDSGDLSIERIGHGMHWPPFPGSRSMRSTGRRIRCTGMIRQVWQSTFAGSSTGIRFKAPAQGRCLPRLDQRCCIGG
ncbi:MAG: hypothetical protein GDA40_05160 [Rhodobacteraceae bacterium]|nr:hypothetical protein [Paracoccaceae bacterium]